MIDQRELEEHMSEAEVESEPAAKPKRSMRWVVVAAIVAAVAAVGWFVTQSDSSADVVEVAPLTFAEVVRTDLVEETEYDGTLGRTAGDALTAPVAGTVTALPEPGDTILQGDVVYEIDAEPTVLLYGDLPQYRTLAISAETQTVGARTSGTVTYAPEPGTIIEQGDVLYEIDGQPVVALYGDEPAYRRLADLSTNIVGEDVRQLEEALDALGFVSAGEMTVDNEFSGATASVVEQWQESIGAEEDGAVDLGEVVFVGGSTQITSTFVAVGDTVNPGQSVVAVAGSEPMEGADVAQLEAALDALGFDAEGSMTVDDVFTAETADAVRAFETAYGLDVDGQISRNEVVFVSEAVRISDTVATVGASVNLGSPLLAVTGEESIVTVNLPAEDQGTIEEGMAVTVELPDRTLVPATVTSVATVATIANNSTVFVVEVVLDDPTAAAGLDEAPVDVLVVTDSADDVIAVPVAALLALSEGGYAVQVDSGDGTTRLVAVDPGFFADGLVEVETDGLAAGDMVVIP